MESPHAVTFDFEKRRRSPGTTLCLEKSKREVRYATSDPLVSLALTGSSMPPNQCLYLFWVFI